MDFKNEEITKLIDLGFYLSKTEKTFVKHFGQNYLSVRKEGKNKPFIITDAFDVSGKLDKKETNLTTFNDVINYIGERKNG